MSIEDSGIRKTLTTRAIRTVGGVGLTKGVAQPTGVLGGSNDSTFLHGWDYQRWQLSFNFLA